MIKTWRQMFRRGALAIAMALALSCGSLGPANALSIGDNGSLAVPSDDTFGRFITGTTSFVDSYDFQVDSPAIFDAFVLNFNIFGSAAIDKLQATLKTGVTVLAQSAEGNNSVLELLSIVDYSALASGTDYSLIITGDVSGQGGYVGFIQLSAVPVPAALPLFGAALMLGFGFMRRRIRADTGHDLAEPTNEGIWSDTAVSNG